MKYKVIFGDNTILYNEVKRTSRGLYNIYLVDAPSTMHQLSIDDDDVVYIEYEEIDETLFSSVTDNSLTLKDLNWSVRWHDGKYILVPNERISICDKCDTLEWIDNLYTVKTPNDWQMWCEECCCDGAHQCDDCGAICSDDLMEEVYDADGNPTGNYVCESCSYEYSRCPSCGRLFRWEDTDVDEYCRECKPSPKCIKGYHNKHYFDPLVKDKYLIGVELEVVHNYEGASLCDGAEFADEFSNNEEKLYLSHDSSLTNGFEIVTSPMTLEYLENDFDFPTLCGGLKERGYISHDSSCCGLHIHLSKEWFQHEVVSEQIIVGLYTMLFQKYEVQTKKISRRKGDYHWCHYPCDCEFSSNRTMYDKNTLIEKAIALGRRGVSRYDVVNTCSSQRTYEVRLFKGTLKYTTIFADVELCVAMLKFVFSFADNVYNGDIEELPEWSDFTEWLLANNKYKYLINYLQTLNLL